MALKRLPDKLPWRTRFITQLKRLWIDIVVLSIMFGLSFLLPDTEEEARKAGSQMNLLALFITKTNSVLWPWLLVDVVRRWKWPYLDLHCLISGKDNQGNEVKNAQGGIVFLCVIYAVVIYCFAKGG